MTALRHLARLARRLLRALGARVTRPTPGGFGLTAHDVDADLHYGRD